MTMNSVMIEPVEVDKTFDIEIYNKDKTIDVDLYARGDDGRGIISAKVKYLAGESPTERPIGEWSDTIVEVPQGQYLWEKITYTYSDGTEYTSYLNSYRAIDGVSVIGISILYQEGNDATTVPSGTWSDSFITVDPGKFLWAKLIYTFSDESTETQYMTTYMGDNGATFIPYVDNNGVIHWTNNKGLVNPDPVNIKGPKGDTGDRGFCPTANVVKTGHVATITITDLEGTTTATVSDGLGDMSTGDYVDAGGTGIVLNSRAIDGKPLDNSVNTNSIWTSDKIISNTSSQIATEGVNTYYGTDIPSPSLGKTGDLYILIEDSSSI